MKKHFVLFLFLFSNIFLFAKPPFDDYTGDGTAGNPYKLYTKDHLLELGDSINASMDPDFSTWHFNKHFRLMQDITDTLRQSIGRSAVFKGHFHGAGKKIIVAISTSFPPDPSNCPYLFTVLYLNCIIDSLIVEGYLTGVGAVGIVYNNCGTISHCINNATITDPFGASPDGITYQNEGTIINCLNNGDITGVDCVAGIAGDNQTGTIINCINTGKITATNSGSAPNGVSGVGGIAAFHKNNISNCINLGTVEGQNNVGGIVGWASPLGNTASQITNCINYGYVKGINNVGGILGYMYNQNVNISNCINAGVVEGSSDVGSITGKE